MASKRRGSSTSEPFIGSLAPGHVFEAKLSCPPSRSDWIQRDRLLRALDETVHRPVTLVSAPAGYGKTTLLAQWLARPQRPATAWLSLDADDNDPDRLWAEVAVALGRAGCRLPVRETWGSEGYPPRQAFTRGLLPALARALAVMPGEIVLVLDDFHCVQEAACHEQLQHLIANLPPQAHLVILTRSDPGLRLGRLRASGDLTELRAKDLGFTETEAAELLAGARVHLTDASMATLMDRTEGWPAGVYLATLSLAGLPDPDAFVDRFGGGNRFVGDYLIEEVLSRQSERVRRFLNTASFLDRFCASLCDHVAGTDDAAALLHDLERSNLFMVPLDEEHQWFRFHHLFAAVARSELELRDPDAVRTLHSRAADWFSVQGHVDRTVEHLLAAGRLQDAARTIQGSWLAHVDAGRAATVAGWLEAMGAEAVAAIPEARVTAAWMAGIAGDQVALAEHLRALDDLVEQRDPAEDGPLPDGTTSISSAVHLVRAAFGYDGPLDMLTSARQAVAIETDVRSPHRAVAQLALGHAAYLLGNLDEALEALHASSRSETLPEVVLVQSLSLQSLVKDEQDDLLAARDLAERAMDVVEAQGLRATRPAALALTAFGLSQAAAGKVDDALLTMEEDLDPRRQPRARESWSSTLHLLATARVAALAGRFPLAHELINEVVRRTARFVGGTEALEVRIARVKLLLRDHDTSELLGEPLTSRELDVLRMLESDLSPQEIAEELYLTLNTVKTHASAIYRKLGAHSRSEAVVTARRHALL